MCHYKWPKPHKQSARLIGTRCQNGKKGKTKKRRGRSPACRLLWLYIWNEGECFFVFFLWDWAFMNRRSWDSASCHWLASLQCASPPGRRTEKPSGSCCKREGFPHCGSPFLCSPLNRTGLDHNTHPLSAAPSGGHGLCEAVKRRRPGWGVEGGGCGCGVQISVLLFGPQGGGASCRFYACEERRRRAER